MNQQVPHKPGTYRGLSMNTYFEIDAIGHSQIKLYENGPPEFEWGIKHPVVESKAMKAGSAIDCYWLEPQRYTEEYCAEPDIEIYGRRQPTKAQLKEDPEYPGDKADNPRNCKKYQDQLARYESAGYTVLTQPEIDLMKRQYASLEAHPVISNMRKTATDTQLTVVWEEDGLLLKCRPDLACEGGWFADLKSTVDLPGFSPWELTNRRYYRQMAFYRRGLNAHGWGLEHDDCYLIAVSNQGACQAARFPMGEAAMIAGEREVEMMLATHRNCMTSRSWPSEYLTHDVPGDITDTRFNKIMNPEEF